MALIEIPQLQHLLEKVGQKFGRPTATSTDFEILSIDIERETGELLSASTLKRLWGYVSLHPTPRVATLDILSRYVGQKDFQAFCRSLRNEAGLTSDFFGAACVSVRDMQAGDRLQLGWAPDRLVLLDYLGHFEFEVRTSVHSQLRPGDRFELADAIVGCPLYIARILRDGSYTHPYLAAASGGLNLVRHIPSEPEAEADHRA